MITICFNLEGVLKKTQQSRLDGLDMIPHEIVNVQQKYSERKEVHAQSFYTIRVNGGPPTAEYSETAQTRASSVILRIRTQRTIHTELPGVSGC
jgi:hypothetical protein